MNAISTGRIKGQKKKTGRIKGQKKKYGSVLEAAKQFRGIACDPAVAPEDHDWHWVICADAFFYLEIDEEAGEYVQKKVEKPYYLATAFYTGSFWTFGAHIPNRPVTIYAWDQYVSPIMRNRNDTPDTDGAVRIAEAVIEQWRGEYESALIAQMETPTKENAQNVKKLERDFPDWLAPAGVTKESALRAIRERVAAEVRGLRP